MSVTYSPQRLLGNGQALTISYTLGQFVRERRMFINMTQVEMAELIGVDQTWVSRLEKGYTRTLPEPVMLRKIAQALGLSMVTLMSAIGYGDSEETSDVEPEPTEAEVFFSMHERVEGMDLPEPVKDHLKTCIAYMRGLVETTTRNR